jgi:hypothetical protein
MAPIAQYERLVVRRVRLKAECRSSVPALVSNSQLGEEDAGGFGEYGQVNGAVSWPPTREVNAPGLEIAGKAVHERADLAGDQVLGLCGIGLFV